jgi:hypothetical protein
MTKPVSFCFWLFEAKRWDRSKGGKVIISETALASYAQRSKSVGSMDHGPLEGCRLGQQRIDKGFSEHSRRYWLVWFPTSEATHPTNTAYHSMAASNSYWLGCVFRDDSLRFPMRATNCLVFSHSANSYFLHSSSTSLVFTLTLRGRTLHGSLLYPLGRGGEKSA